MMYILWGFLGTITLVVILFIGLATRKAVKNKKGQVQTVVLAAPRKRRSWGWLGWVVVALVALGVYQWYRSPKTPTSRPRPVQQATVVTQYDSLINEATQKYGVDPKLIGAVIQQESGFNPNAVGGKGEKGLMQLMPATIDRYGISDPFDPQQNIDAGTRYLADMLKRYGGNTELALAAYNAGEDAVDKNQIPDSTRNVYVPSVMALYKGGVSLPATAAALAIPVSTAPPVVAATTTEVVAKPNQWSENVSVPSSAAVRIEPKGKIQIRFWDGRIIDDEPGKDNWPKGCIRNGNFRVLSREDGDVKVVVNIGPK